MYRTPSLRTISRNPLSNFCVTNPGLPVPIMRPSILTTGITSAAVPVSGIVVTKLDGTARGGVVVAVHEAIDVPVKFLSVGEAAEDLVAFDAAEFSQELLAEE